MASLSLLQKGHVTTAAQRTERAIDGNLCALGVSAVRFCSEVIIVLNETEHVGARHAVPRPEPEQFGKPVPGSIPTIVRSFKSAATKCINEYRSTPGAPVWQCNYYEHIIRTEESLNCIREYILTNPLRWHLDRQNMRATGTDPMDVEWFD